MRGTARAKAEFVKFIKSLAGYQMGPDVKSVPKSSQKSTLKGTARAKFELLMFMKMRDVFYLGPEPMSEPVLIWRLQWRALQACLGYIVLFVDTNM